MKSSTSNTEPPKIKIELTSTDRFMEGLSALILLTTWVMAIWFFSKLPDRIPSHFDDAGNITDQSSKWVLFLLPMIATIIFITLRILSRFPHVFNYPLKVTEKTAPHVYAFSTKMVRSLNLGIVFFFSLAELMIVISAQGVNPEFGILLIPFLLITTITFLIYSIRKLFILGKEPA